MVTKKGTNNNRDKVSSNPNYRPSYNSTDEVNKDLEMSYEQLTDMYMAGMIDGDMDSVGSNEEDSPRK